MSLGIFYSYQMPNAKNYRENKMILLLVILLGGHCVFVFVVRCLCIQQTKILVRRKLNPINEMNEWAK